MGFYHEDIAFCGYEFTRALTGWHYHAHILAFRKAWYEHEGLARDWQKATRDRGGIVDIRAVTNSAEGLRNVLQYCLKPTDLAKWTAEDVRQFQSLSRVKLSECFGELRGLNLQDSEDCSLKSEPLFVGYPCPEVVNLSRELEFPGGKCRDSRQSKTVGL